MVESSTPILRRCVGFAGLGTPPKVISSGEMSGTFRDSVEPAHQTLLRAWIYRIGL